MSTATQRAALDADVARLIARRADMPGPELAAAWRELVGRHHDALAERYREFAALLASGDRDGLLAALRRRSL